MWTAVLYGVAASSSLIIGAAIGARWSPPAQLTRVLLAFAGGAVLASVADTLMPEAFEHGRPLNAFATAGGFFLSYVLSA